MNAAQCRMARAGLGLSINDLAELAKVRAMSISKFERGGNVVASTVETLRQVLASEGAQFENGGKLVGVKVPRRD